jgi:hypothetical protein
MKYILFSPIYREINFMLQNPYEFPFAIFTITEEQLV